MEDDEIYSYPSPSSNGRITVTVAAAPPPSSSTPPQNTLTLALPIQQHKTPGSSSGGREDCWSEDATAVLIDAWGERYIELSRGNLKQKHWKDVADIVSSREDYTKTPKTDIQCKNRIDTVKKKYKAEKAKIASVGGSSKWRFFDKIDQLIGPTAKASPWSTHKGDANSMYEKVPMGIPVGVRSGSIHQNQLQQKPNLRSSKRPKVQDSDEESEHENSADSSDGLPPVSYKRPRIQREVVTVNNNPNMRSGMMNKNSEGGSRTESKEVNWGDLMRELTQSILKLGEAYEQAETAKLKQVIEMEKQRMEFAKELELQRMQVFMKMQVELSQLRPANNNNDLEINDTNDVNNDNDDNNNNNSDSSN